MRRDVFATLRRGLDNTLANWHLIAVRVAEMFLFGAIAVIAAIVILVPIVVSIEAVVDRSAVFFESDVGVVVRQVVNSARG